MRLDRRHMLAIVETEGKDHFAHPMFWAPFVVVGEGGTPADALAARPDDEPESASVEPNTELKRASVKQNR
jgi:hypothetical protein